MVCVAVSVVIGLVMCGGVATGQIVDHDDVDGVASLPQSTMDAIGQQTWFFSHASVGSNMVSGMTSLHSADPNRYQLSTTSVSYNSGQQRAYDPPDPTVNGTIYDCSRGNPGWQDKLTIFDNSVRVTGWHDPDVDAAMDKFCYIDQNADPNQYISIMTALEASYPNTVFVYVTMPLMTSENSDNVKRNDYNDAVRAHCISNGKLLFDIADMEAHDPNGVAYTFSYSGGTYQKLYSGYTSDGGHLNTAGQQRIALGWYATAAVIVGEPATYTLTLEIVNSAWGSVAFDPEPNDPNLPTYPADANVTLTATPNEGKGFKHWVIYDPNYPGDANHVVLDANASTTIVMDADREVTAAFKCGGGGMAPLWAAGLLLMGVMAAVRRRQDVSRRS